MKWILLVGLVVLVTHPALILTFLGLIGTVAVWAAAQPTVLAFALGALAWPRITDRMRRLTR